MEIQPDDPRHTELETLEAIFPEIKRPHPVKEPFTFTIEIPVQPADAITVTFPAASGPDIVINGAASHGENGQPEIDSLQVSHLPALSLRICLPEGYPEDRPPFVSVSTSPQWLPQETLSKLEDDGPRLWEEVGRDMVAYTYIDHVQRAADDVFGAINVEGVLEVDPEHKVAVLDHDIKAKKAAFEKESFECGVCLDPKKGFKCHKMLDCGHIFCLQCLQDFYNDAIHEGNLSTVRCLAPNCAKERAKAEGGKKPKTWISPSELLQIGLCEDMVKRYVTLKYKTELESDKNTIYCPRSWCNGAARSKKHKKPDGLQFQEAADFGSDEEEQVDPDREPGKSKKKKKPFDPADLVAICEDCGYAFCAKCLQSWHGQFVRCTPKRDKTELTEEEKASLEYLQLHTSPCPTCNAPAQKTHGCNHMICSRCDTHFCYLCSSWLDPGNPYKHYNTQSGGKVTSCYMRLWELEGGDGDDVGLGFGGGQHPRAPHEVQQEAVDEIPLIEEDSESDAENDVQQGNPLPHARGGPAVALEAPLVLRLNIENQAPVPEAQQPVRGAERRQNDARRGRGNANRGRGGAPPRGGRGARGGRGQQVAGRGRGGNAPPVPIMGLRPEGGAGDPLALDEAQQAWVRNFVQLALMDAEDEFGGDSDEEDGHWLIR